MNAKYKNIILIIYFYNYHHSIIKINDLNIFLYILNLFKSIHIYLSYHYLFFFKRKYLIRLRIL